RAHARFRSWPTSDHGSVVGEAATRWQHRRWRNDVLLASPQSVEVSSVDDPRVRLRAATVASHLFRPVEYRDLAVADEDLDCPPHERVRNAVPDRVHVDEAVGSDAPRDPSLSDRQWIR